MPSRTFALALKSRHVRQQRLRDSRKRDAQARERTVDLMLQYSVFMYHQFGRHLGAQPPSLHQLRAEFMAEVLKPNSCLAPLISSAKQNGYSFSMHRWQTADCATTQQREKPMPAVANDPGPILIKRYANTRYYDTERCCYVSLADLADLARDGCTITVQDAKTGGDITGEVMKKVLSRVDLG